MTRVHLPGALFVALILSACQTVVVQSHRDPSAGRPTFERPLAVVNLSGYEDSESIRRAGEMELVNGLPDLNLVPSYRFFSLEELADVGAVKRRAYAEGFDGLVLLWVSDVRVTRGTLGSDGHPWAGSTSDVRISAAIVSIADDREVWSGLVQRRDATGSRKDVRAIARAVARRLRSDHVVD